MIGSTRPRYLLVAIMVAVLAWGVFHACGALRYNGNPWRGIVVLACFAAFVGSWLLLLGARRRRLAQRPKH